MIRRTTNSPPPRKVCRGNLRPAPFSITPDVVAKVVSLTERPAARVVQVPVEPVKLVDRPRPSASARSGKGEEITRFDSDHGAAANDECVNEPAKAGNQARKSDTVYRQELDRLSRELEEPVDVRLHKGERPRIEIIRAAARKLAGVKAAEKARLPLGARVEKRATAPSGTPYEQRRALLERAIRYLKANFILVTPCDRFAQIRRYRVSGKREPMLAEDVIAHAIARGMEVQA
ncbi:MAG: hypothetical protein AB7L36_00715 [Sphingomonadaceae bacterium]